ncbi:MAG: sigma-54-dependent transcriptional regulator [Paracoccaceae bacterium]
MEGTILIADDDKTIRTVLVQAFTRAGCKVHATASLTTLIRWVGEGKGDVVISDIFMPDGNGLEALETIYSIRPNLPVIIISAQSNVKIAVEASRSKAYDYFPKPFNLPDILKIVSNILKNDINDLEVQDVPEMELDIPLVGQSIKMQSLYKKIAKVINIELPILILGESGVGKSLIANMIHNFSDLKNHSFKTIHAKELNKIENISSFFHDDNIGTVLLDEVADLSQDAQSLIVQALDEFKGGKPKILSTSQRNLEDLMQKDIFRKDLFYRLNGISILVPPLREITEDIELLARYFISLDSDTSTSKVVLSKSVIDKLRGYTWPGNTRQFKNFIKGLMYTCENNTISERDVALALSSQPNIGIDNTRLEEKNLNKMFSSYLIRYFDLHGSVMPQANLYDRVIKEIEGPLLELSLKFASGNQARCAKMLGINRNTLRKKIFEQKINITKGQIIG